MTKDPNVKEIEFQNFSARKAVVEYQDGRRYDGDFDFERLVPDGVGTVVFPDKDPKLSYQGQWENGRMHGIGVFKWRDKSEYDGSYVNGRKEGYGTFRYQSGKVYRGFWKEGKQDGTGILNENVGSAVIGLWKNGELNKIEKEEWEK